MFFSTVLAHSIYLYTAPLLSSHEEKRRTYVFTSYYIATIITGPPTPSSPAANKQKKGGGWGKVINLNSQQSEFRLLRGVALRNQVMNSKTDRLREKAQREK